MLVTSLPLPVICDLTAAVAGREAAARGRSGAAAARVPGRRGAEVFGAICSFFGSSEQGGSGDPSGAIGGGRGGGSLTGCSGGSAGHPLGAGASPPMPRRAPRGARAPAGLGRSSRIAFLYTRCSFKPRRSSRDGARNQEPTGGCMAASGDGERAGIRGTHGAGMARAEPAGLGAALIWAGCSVRAGPRVGGPLPGVLCSPPGPPTLLGEASQSSPSKS